MLEVIKASEEISLLFSEGKRLHTQFITLIVSDTQECGFKGRVAFIAGKKNGNAVWRNSAKRRLRAVCRELPAQPVGYDVIFVAKKGILEPPYSKVLQQCNTALTIYRGEKEQNE